MKTINEMILDAGWFHGTEKEWQALPRTDREAMAFKATRCLIAYPTWQPPVDCVHTCCQVERGELPRIAITNRKLRAELTNWFRFHLDSRSGRQHIARIFRAMRKAARETGEYDPWKLSWATIVYGGIAEL